MRPPREEANRTVQTRGRAVRNFQVLWSGGWSVYFRLRRTLACSKERCRPSVGRSVLCTQNKLLRPFPQVHEHFSERDRAQYYSRNKKIAPK